jgi:hypothetical protein
MTALKTPTILNIRRRALLQNHKDGGSGGR